jgi:hypothetical protein
VGRGYTHSVFITGSGLVLSPTDRLGDDVISLEDDVVSELGVEVVGGETEGLGSRVGEVAAGRGSTVAEGRTPLTANTMALEYSITSLVLTAH